MSLDLLVAAAKRCFPLHGLPADDTPCPSCRAAVAETWDEDKSPDFGEAQEVHVCTPPAGPRLQGDYDAEWTCPDCGQAWFVGRKDACVSCHRDDGPEWARFGTGDGAFPLVSVRRGGMTWGGRRG